MLMMMMMMLDYVNILFVYDSMSVSILSQKDNYYTFIPRSYVFIGGSGGGDGDGDTVLWCRAGMDDSVSKSRYQYCMSGGILSSKEKD